MLISLRQQIPPELGYLFRDMTSRTFRLEDTFLDPHLVVTQRGVYLPDLVRFVLRNSSRLVDRWVPNLIIPIESFLRCSGRFNVYTLFIFSRFNTRMKHNFVLISNFILNLKPNWISSSEHLIHWSKGFKFWPGSLQHTTRTRPRTTSLRGVEEALRFDCTVNVWTAGGPWYSYARETLKCLRVSMFWL